MGRQTAAPRANQAPAKSCLSSDGCPPPGPSRLTTGTRPQQRRRSAGTPPRRASFPPLPPLGAASRRPTEAEHSSRLCPLGPGALALEHAAFCDPTNQKLSGGGAESHWKEPVDFSCEQCYSPKRWFVSSDERVRASPGNICSRDIEAATCSCSFFTIKASLVSPVNAFTVKQQQDVKSASTLSVHK